MPDDTGIAWLKIQLDGVYCVSKVVRYRSLKRRNNHTHMCTQRGCELCKGYTCRDFKLSVYVENTAPGTAPDTAPGTAPGAAPGTSCKMGDTVEFRTDNGYYIAGYDVAIFVVSDQE